jgi:hypothetical protein
MSVEGLPSSWSHENSHRTRGSKSIRDQSVTPNEREQRGLGFALLTAYRGCEETRKADLEALAVGSQGFGQLRVWCSSGWTLPFPEVAE